MRTHSTAALLALLALLVASVAPTAPAPLPPRERAAAVIEFTGQGVANGPAAEQALGVRAAVLRSRLVLLDALRRPGVAALGCMKGQPDPAVWLEARLAVRPVPGTRQFRVSVRGCTGAEAVTLVDAVLAAAQRRGDLARLRELEQVAQRNWAVQRLGGAPIQLDMQRVSRLVPELHVVQPARAIR